VSLRILASSQTLSIIKIELSRTLSRGTAPRRLQGCYLDKDSVTCVANMGAVASRP